MRKLLEYSFHLESSNFSCSVFLLQLRERAEFFVYNNYNNYIINNKNDKNKFLNLRMTARTDSDME
jgi:hypothetical protein